MERFLRKAGSLVALEVPREMFRSWMVFGKCVCSVVWKMCSDVFGRFFCAVNEDLDVSVGCRMIYGGVEVF